MKRKIAKSWQAKGLLPKRQNETFCRTGLWNLGKTDATGNRGGNTVVVNAQGKIISVFSNAPGTANGLSQGFFIPFK